MAPPSGADLSDGEAPALVGTPMSARPARAAKTGRSFVESSDDGGDSDSDASDAVPQRKRPKAAAKPRAKSPAARPRSQPAPRSASESDASSEAADDSGDDYEPDAPMHAKKPKGSPASAAKAGKPSPAPASKPKAGARGASQAPKSPVAAAKSPKKSPIGSVSAKYQKLTQREHVLTRPDTYIGSVARAPCKTWLVDEAGTSVRFEEVELSAGFLKIFDEILVNAMDRQYEDESMKAIRVSVDAASGEITVHNSGKGIPVQLHAEHPGVYIPSLIFGEFLSGENFDDSKVRFIGGRNGIGAKATNVFSARFELELVDPSARLRFRQAWSDNMATVGAPKVTPVAEGTRGYVQVRFLPDFGRFGMEGIDEETMAVLRSRVYDAAACTKPSVRLWFNGAPVEVAKFSEYADLVLGPKEGRARAYEKVLGADGSTVRAEVVAAHSSAGFQCVAFVNGIRCCAGTHVEALVGELAKGLIERLCVGKRKGLALKPYMVRNQLALVARLLVNNPTFDSQSKDRLCSPQREWGFKLALSPRFVREVERSGVGDAVLAFCDAKERSTLSKDSAVRRNGRVLVDKLDDALNAGKPGSSCTLILTEGDSAKALAVAGVSVVGRHNYGIFPLRGKPLNTRNVALKKLKENAEICQLMRIIGLEFGKVYTSLSSLRYKSITIFADQDLDGHHIAGLIVNLVHSQWPSLLRICPDFIRRFATPIVKVTRGSSELGFFTVQEFAEWRAANPAAGGRVKYLKGLGSSNNLDAKKYFSHLDEHVVVLRRVDDGCDEALITAFDPDKADARKEWLRDCYQPDSYIDYGVDEISIKRFFDEEFIHFSIHDNARSIPSALDGFKPTQRKVMHVFLKRKLRQDVKVSQIGGGIAEATGYHHGETSLVETIVGMAQQHVGTNNINLLKPEGQFGSRLAKPSVHAQARYIFTALEPIATRIFRAEDEPLLALREEEGQVIEPELFLPILPLVLVNGAAGIGTGWMTDVPCFHPLAVAHALEQLIQAAADGLLGPADELDDGQADALWDELVGEDEGGLAAACGGGGGGGEVAAAAAAGAAAAGAGTAQQPQDPFADENGEDEAVRGPDGAALAPPAGAQPSAPKHAPPPSDRYGPPRGTARDPLTTLEPWYDGFCGTILPDAAQAHLPAGSATAYTAYGKWKVRSSAAGGGHPGGTGELDTVEITELPVGRWTDDFVSDLGRRHTLGGEKACKEAFIRSVDNLSTECTVRLVLHCEPEPLRAVLESPGGLCKALRLSAPLRTSNMFLFDHTRRLRRFRSPKEIVRAFFDWRRPLYAARHRLLDEQLSAQIELLRNQQRFVSLVATSQLRLHGRTRVQLDADLAAAGLKRLARGGGGGNSSRAGAAGEQPVECVADDGTLDDGSSGGAPASTCTAGSYDYLLQMHFLSLSREKAEELQAEIDSKSAALLALRAKTPLDLWQADLADFRQAYVEFVEARAARNASYESLKAKVGEAGVTLKTKRTGGGSKKAKQRN